MYSFVPRSCGQATISDWHDCILMKGISFWSTVVTSSHTTLSVTFLLPPNGMNVAWNEVTTVNIVPRREPITNYGPTFGWDKNLLLASEWWIKGSVVHQLISAIISSNVSTWIVTINISRLLKLSSPPNCYVVARFQQMSLTLSAKWVLAQPRTQRFHLDLCVTL